MTADSIEDVADGVTERVDSIDLLTIFLVSGAVMIYQIALMRTLSVVAWYHFAFLVISMVMLGLGAPGIWFAFGRNPVRLLPAFLLASGVAVPASVAVIVAHGAAMVEASVFYLVLAVVPATLALGGVVCLLLIKASGPQITRMYGSDLVGAALGAAVVIPLLHVVPTPTLAAATGTFPLVSLMLRSGPMRLVALGLLAVLGVTVVEGSLYHVTRSKSYDETVNRPIFEDWSPTARITVFDSTAAIAALHFGSFTWGRGDKFPKGSQVEHLWIEQDGGAGTPITRFDGGLDGLEHLFFDVTALAHQLRPPRSVAVIGAGGGRDILSALLAGATDIDAVELNAHTIDTVTHVFGEYSGDIYHHEGVHAIANEGRSYLTHTEKRFDLIQISLIDSWAASMAGAFALAENNLYTVEAFELYARRLAPGGLISTSRWMSEMPRLVILARAALRSMGIDRPERHMVIAEAGQVGTLLVSKEAFTKRDIQRLDAICEQRGFVRLHPIMRGEKPPEPFIAKIAFGGSGAMAGLGVNTAPPTDDSPYFFHLLSPFRLTKLAPATLKQVTGLPMNTKSTIVLRQAILGVIALALLLFLTPFVLPTGAISSGDSKTIVLRSTTYFGAIGFAFMLIENLLIQRFVLYLGHPSLAATVIIASLLLGMGIGSMGADRIGVARLKSHGALVPIILAVVIAVLPAFFSATLGVAQILRIGASIAILVPLGGMLGTFFPLGMLAFGDRGKPWYWAINGVFGVAASVLSVALSMDFGFTVVGSLGVMGYLIACVCLRGAPTPPAPALASNAP